MVKLIRFIEIEDFRKVLKAEKDKKFKLAYVLGFGSGLRISEIVGLREQICKICDSDVVTKTIEIEGKKRKRLYCAKCNKYLISLETKRSNHIWKIEPLTKQQVNLQSHTIKVLGKGNKERITMTSKWLNETNIKLLPLKINRRTLQNRFSNLCEKVLGRKLNFHTLRHGWANHLANERNLPLPQLQALGGWSRLDTVGMYTKANPKKAVEAAFESF